MFLERLASCTACPRQCKVNRLAGEIGFCRIGADFPVAHASRHFGEEPPISGSRGSGTIFFVGCNLRCLFCQNYQISQEFHLRFVRRLDVEGLAREMLRLQALGAHNINLVSPTHMVYGIADAIDRAREEGLTLSVVYNSNGYDSIEVLRAIRGRIDVFMPDIKYMDDALGNRLSGVSNYARVIPDVLEEMFDQVWLLRFDSEGVARRGLMVRHLVLPGYLENSRRCLEVIARLCPETHVSLLAQYSPQYRAFEHPKIDRLLSPEEYEEIVSYASELGLANLYLQHLPSRESFLPDFDQKEPFSSSHSERDGDSESPKKENIEKREG